MADNKITPNMAGTWLDGSAGWHNNYRVVYKAVGWGGFNLTEEESRIVHAYSQDGGPSMDVDDLYVMDGLTERATEHFQSLAPEGYGFIWDAGELSMVHGDSVLDY
jgi:hypothetical protein